MKIVLKVNNVYEKLQVNQEKETKNRKQTEKAEKKRRKNANNLITDLKITALNSSFL